MTQDETARRMRPLVLAIGLALSGVMLAACAPAPHPVQPTAPPLASPPPSATSTPAPTTATSAPAQTEGETTDWIVDFDGVGPFRMGASLTDALGAVLPPYEVEPAANCPSPATTMLSSATSPTIWLVESADTGRIGVVAVGGDVPGDAREAGSPRTASGVGIGSPLSEVEAAFPGGIVESGAEDEPDRFVVSGSASSDEPRYLVFTLFEGDVQTILVQTSSESVGEFCG